MTDIGDFFSPLIPGSLNYANDFQKNSSPTVAGIPQLYEFEDGDKKVLDTGIHIGYSFCTAAPGKFYYQDGNKSIAYNGAVRTLSNVNEDRTRNTNWQSEVSDGNAISSYDLYWSQYIDHLYENNNVKVSTTVLLSPTDYQTLNINDTVHIDGNDYLINKINGFNLSESAEATVELISYKNNFTNVYEAPTIRYVDPLDADNRTDIVGINIVALRAVDGSLVPWDIPVLQQDIYQIRLEGEATSTITETVTVRQIEGFDLKASNFTDITAPAGVTVGLPYPDGDGLKFDITVEIQPDHQFELLTIRGEVDMLAAGDRDVNLATTSTTTGLVVDNPNIEQFGEVGTQSTFRVYLSVPDTDKQVDITTINATTSDGVSLIGRSDFGTGAQLVFSGIITDVEAFHTASVSATLVDIPMGADIVEHTVNFAEAAGYQNVSIYPTSITYTGAVGEQHDFVIQVAPFSGYMTTATSWSVTDTTDGVVDDAVGIQDGYSVGIPITLVTPPLGTPTTMASVLGKTADLIGAKTYKNTVNIQASGSTFNYGNRSTTFDLEGVPGATGIFQLDVSPEELFTFRDLTTLTFDASNGIEYDSVSLVGGSLIVNFKYTIGEADNPNGTITHNNGVADMENSSLKFIINNTGVDGVTFSTGEFNYGYDYNLSGNGFTAIPETKVTVTPKTGIFTNRNELTVSTDNTASGLGNVNYDVSSFPFDLNTDGSITFEITGRYPTVGGHYVITIDVSGSPGLKPAESGAFAVEAFLMYH